MMDITHYTTTIKWFKANLWRNTHNTTDIRIKMSGRWNPAILHSATFLSPHPVKNMIISKCFSSSFQSRRRLREPVLMWRCVWRSGQFCLVFPKNWIMNLFTWWVSDCSLVLLVNQRSGSLLNLCLRGWLTAECFSLELNTCGHALC